MTRLSMKILWAALVLASNVASARPFTASDLVTLREIGSVTVAPNGRWVAWDQRETDLASNRVNSRLWLLDLGRPGEARELSVTGHHPQFAADGEWIYYLSDDQLWRVPTGKGVAQQVSDFDVSITGYSLSPTGNEVAIWADVSTACNELPCELPQPVDTCCGSGKGFDAAYVQRDGAWRRQQARSTIYVPHRDEWMMPEIRSRVFVMSVNGGTAKSAMGRWLGDAQRVAWAADGKTLFFTLREARREERFSLNLDVIESRIHEVMSTNEPRIGGVAPRNESRIGESTTTIKSRIGESTPTTKSRIGESTPTNELRVGEVAPTNLTAANAGVDALPAASPDGRWLAYVSARVAGDTAKATLQLRDLATGIETSLDESLNVRSIAWTDDSRSLLVTARAGMDEPLFHIALDGRKVTRLTTEGHVTNVIPMAQGGAVFTLDSMLQPSDLYRISAEGEVTRLTAINEDRLLDIDTPHLERFDFKGAKGASVSAWMIAPTLRDDRRPAVLLIQDGVHAEAANSWSRHWNPWLFAAPGYAVIGVDFHTSGPRIERDKLALDDLKLGLAALNADNACIAGDGAYGGYLAYRIAAEWSQQPRCLIANGGVVDAIDLSYQTDEPWMHDWQTASTGSRNGHWNLLQSAPAWRTPLLILHGERNFRVPYSQSLAAFTAAQRRNVPSRLVVFPDEGVQVQAPKNTIQWYGEVFNWLDRWLPQRD